MFCRGIGIPEARCKIRRVPQLQLRDVERFKNEGLPHLFEIVQEYLRDPQRKYEGGVVLNPTGGFKGVVPFISLLGMLYGASVVYGSRASQQLVSLPPIPITHDRQIFEQAKEALAWAERQGVFKCEEFLGRVSGLVAGEEERFSAFLEITPDGEAALSPLAKVLVQKERDEYGEVLLSPIAADKLRAMIGPQKSAALAWLQRTGSATWRAGNGHAFHGSDLNVFGEKKKPIRVAGFCKDKKFYLCQFYFDDHVTYDRELANFQRSHFQDIESFVPLHKDTFGEDSAMETWSDLLAEREIWKVEREELISDKQDINKELHEVHLKIGTLRKEEKQKRDELW